MQTKNARFWTRHNGGHVQITLRPGQALEAHAGGPTDEGYSWTQTRWTLSDDTVTVEYHTHACDCDGPLDTAATLHCDLTDLASGYHCPDSGIRFPDWQHADTWQRDCFAEAAGY